MTRLAERLSRLPLRRPLGALLCAFVVSVLAGVALSRLELQLDVTEMLPTPAARTLTRVAEEFGINEKAYVLVEADGPGREDDLRRFALGLQARLADKPTVAGTEWALPVSRDAVVDTLLVPYGLLFQDPEDLEQLLTPDGLRTQLETTLERLSLLGMGEAEEWAERDPLDLNRALARRASSLRGGLQVAEGSEEFLSPDRQALLIGIAGSYGGAASLGDARTLVRDIEAARRELLREPWARGLSASGTGGPYLSEESERVIMTDVQVSFGASIAIALALLALGLRLRLGSVVLLLVPTLWGTFVGAGLFALLRPSLAVLSLGCSAILIGLGVDFTVHLTAHALGARAAGLEAREAVYLAVRDTRGALALAAFSSAAAFAAFLSSGTQILRDMGLLTACGLAACLVGALTVLPVLLLARGITGGRDPMPPRTLGVLAVARFATRRPLLVLGVACLLSLLAGLALVQRPPGLETDLRRLQAADSPVLATQDRVEARYGGSSDGLVLLVRAEDPDAVIAACHRLEPTLDSLKADGALRSRTSVAGLVPPLAAQERCRELLRTRGADQLRADLRAAFDDVGFDPDALSGYVEALSTTAERGVLDVATMDRLGLGPLVGRFVRADEEQAYGIVQLTAAPGLWKDPARAAETLRRLRAGLAEAGVTAGLGGLPLVSQETSELVSRDFGKVAGFTLLAVLAGLLVRFRGLERVLLVLLPALLGTLWTAGVFAACGWKLNLMNLGVLPMVLAIGVDDGIHVMHQVLGREGTPLLQSLRGTAVGVLLTSLTTMVTFGSLALSANQGIASVGLLCFFGIGSCLVATIAVLPAVLSLRGER